MYCTSWPGTGEEGSACHGRRDLTVFDRVGRNQNLTHAAPRNGIPCVVFFFSQLGV